MNYLLLLLSCFFNGLKSVFAKKSNAVLSEEHNVYTYNFYMFFVAFLIVAVYGLSGWKGLSLATAIYGTLYGVALIFAQIFLIRAMDLGGVSVSSLFYSCGFLLPTFTGVLFYEETVSVFQLVGVALILVSFIITTSRGERLTVKWFVLAIAALLCNGAVGVLQKLFRMSEYKAEQSGLMVVAFLVGTLFAFLLMPKRRPFLPSARFLGTAAVSGTTLGLVNTINVHISGLLPSIVVFPSVNGGGIVAAALLAYLLIGEKLSKKKTAGVLLGVLAICLIAL